MGRPSMEIVLVPFPAQGHVTPMFQLAKALHACGFHPILALPDFIHVSLTAKIASEYIDRVEFASISSGLDKDGAREFAAIDEAMESCMPGHLESLLRRRGPERLICVVVDLLASWAIGVAARCGVPVAGFWPAMQATYRLISAIPELVHRGLISDCGSPLDKQSSCHYSKDKSTGGAVEEELLLLGQAKLSTKDLPWLVGNSASQKSRFTFWLRTLDRASTLPWLLINSFPQEDELDERSQLTPLPWAWEEGPRIFQVGSLLARSDDDNISSGCSLGLWDEDKSCIEWLEKQAPRSVIYVSFGTWVGPLGPEKLTEFALGLEATHQPFLWVLREDAAWRAGLPNGYIDRVAKQGKVVRWAPQEAVLKHKAVGCYLTHCGWNSTLEAIRHGQRLLCYPISGDQFVNCAYIVRVWRIGLKLNEVHRAAIYESIQRVMLGTEGEDVQMRILELRKQVMGNEGSSTAKMNLQYFIDDVKKTFDSCGRSCNLQ